MLVVEAGAAQARSVKTGGRGAVLFDGRSESAVEIIDGVAEGAQVLRGTVGNLRPGTQVAVSAALPAPAPVSATPPATASAAR